MAPVAKSTLMETRAILGFALAQVEPKAYRPSVRGLRMASEVCNGLWYYTSRPAILSVFALSFALGLLLGLLLLLVVITLSLLALLLLVVAPSP